jgi:hypothetical protein
VALGCHTGSDGWLAQKCTHRSHGGGSDAVDR